MGRVITFHYDTQKRMTAVTSAGLDVNGAPTVVTLVRLHYATQSVTTTGAFSGLSTKIRNPSPTMIDAIYYPTTGTGYWFGSDSYSSYGMLVKVVEQRGMSFQQGSSFAEQGTIIQGTVTKQQVYEYPSSPANLTAAPTFAKVTQTWDGGPTAGAITHFLVQDNSGPNERTVTTTKPDLTKTIQKSFNFNNPPDSDPNKFKDGLVKEVQALDSQGNIVQKTIFTWEAGPDKAPRLISTDVTDENDQVLTTEYDQYGDNSSVGRIRERDYNGAIVKTTTNTFVSYLDNDLEQRISPGSGPIVTHPRLVNLVESVKVWVGADSSNILAAHAITKYDEYTQPLKSYIPDYLNSSDLFVFGEPRQSGGVTGILQHSATFNPMPFNNTNGGGSGDSYITRRGNVTSVTRYANTTNASAPTSPITETMTYDMAGNVLSVSSSCCEQTTFGLELATQYGFAVSETRGSADPNSLLRVTTSTVYDHKTGLQLSSTDANGRLTSMSYYLDSLRLKEIISATGARTTIEYDDAGLTMTQTMRLSLNGSIVSKTVKHLNGLGQIKKEQAFAGNVGGIDLWDVVETLYDQHSRPWRQSRPYRAGTETPKFKETVYDAAGRIQEQREPYIDAQDLQANGTITRYFYNEDTRPAGASNDKGQTTKVFDPWDRWRWARLDSNGRLAEVVEPNPAGGSGFITRYFYDVLGNLTRVEQGDQVRRFRYDSVGRTTHQKMAEAAAALNSAGERATSEPESERWSDVFVYDARSNLVSRTDARGVKTQFSYKDSVGNDDPLNRLRSVSYDLSRVDTTTLTVLPAATVNYEYRVKTSPSSLVDITQIKQVVAVGVSTDDYDYDVEGRMKEQRLTFSGKPSPMTTSYTYDALGRLSLMTYPQQYQPGVTTPARKAVIPSYDVASRTIGLKVNNLDYASQIVYNASSQVTSTLIGMGATQSTETYQYNPSSGFLVVQKVQRGTTLLSNLDYGYRKAVCAPNAICQEVPKANSYTGQITSSNKKHYAYDGLGRLTGIWNYNKKPHDQLLWHQSYSYDPYGNRTATYSWGTSGGQPVPRDGAESLTYNTTSNRITTAGYSYDAAGNQTTTAAGQSFVYDAAGRLAKVKNASGVTLVTYTYGSSNRRLITQTGAESSIAKTYYVWQGDSAISEYTEPTSTTMPQWSKNYIYLGSRLLATEQPNGSGGELVQYHHPDRLGTRLVTNNADQTSFYQTGLPFGTALDGESTGTTNRRFTSYDRSSTTGLDYAVNRTYDPRQGRFTQPDPLGMGAANLSDPQSLNMYSYVGNDPVNRVDPDGQFWGALFRFFAGFFSSVKPNIVTGSFTFGNQPPISVSFTPNGQNLSVGYAGISLGIRMGGLWLPDIVSQKTIFSEYKRCRESTFGIAATGFMNKKLPSVEQTGMIFLAGRADPTDSAMIAVIWAHESNFADTPGGDAGPAQLTTWWRTNHPELIQHKAYGNWHGRTTTPFDGGVQDNIETLGNIVRFSRNRYGTLDEIAFHYGPGDTEEMAQRKKRGLKGYGPKSIKVRRDYAKEVMGRYGKYKDFFDCLPHR